MQVSFAITLAMLVLVLAAGIEGGPRVARAASRHPQAGEREGPQTEARHSLTAEREGPQTEARHAAEREDSQMEASPTPRPMVTMPPRSPDSFSPNKQLATLLEPDMMLIADAISKAISDFITGTVPPFADMVSIVVVRFIMKLLLTGR